MKKSYSILRDLEKIFIKKYNVPYKRECYSLINWSSKIAVGLFGERGIGKTTLLIQKRIETENSFYFSADNAIIKANGLFMFVYFCVKEMEVKNFFIDEIFRYENWKEELKNIIDSFDINLYFSGSSSMAIYDGVVDLGRRVVVYKINPLSFREFLKLKYNINLPKIELEELLENHEKISMNYNLEFKQKYFEEYLKVGAYPFGLNIEENEFKNILLRTIDKIIFEDLRHMRTYETESLDKLSKLMYFIANTTPSDLSINHLSQRIGLNKDAVDNTLYLLNKIGVINLVQKGENLSEKSRKEFKIFLGNTNKYFVNNPEPEIGTIREVFFVSEMRKLDSLENRIELSVPNSGDFRVEYLGDSKIYNFEIGGRNKKRNVYPKNTFIVKDDISVSESKNIIPLWLFGFLN